MLTGEDTVGLETVTEVRGERHEMHACLVETAIYDLENKTAVSNQLDSLQTREPTDVVAHFVEIWSGPWSCKRLDSCITREREREIVFVCGGGLTECGL
jgi:hypothetical protein